MKTLKVSGIGKVLAFPDLVSFDIEIEEESKEYSKCTEKMNERVRILYSDVIKAGFQKSDLKTLNLKIDTVYENYDRSPKSFRGYSSKTKLYLEFDYGKEKLNEVISLLTRSKANPVFEIHFGPKDKEMLKKKALEHAVNDSMKKAEIIANASDISLGEITLIDYSIVDAKFEHRTGILCTHPDDEHGPVGYEIEPTEIIASDFVTLEWEIK